MKVYKQLTDYTCGPALIRTILEIDGRRVPSEKRLAQEMATTPERGTRPKAMMQWLNQHGYKARIEQGEPSSSRALIHWVRWTHVILDLGLWGGHYCLIAHHFGKDDWIGGQFVLADPGCGGLIYIPGNILEAIWFSSIPPKSEGLCILC